MVYKTNRQIKDNEKVVLQVNHNFFMRETVATIAKIFLTSLVYTAVVVIIYFAIFSSLGSIATSTTTAAANKAADNGAIAGVLFVGITIVYLVIVIYYAAHLISLHRNITNEEVETLSGGVSSSHTDRNPVKNSTLAEKSRILDKPEEDDDDLF